LRANLFQGKDRFQRSAAAGFGQIDCFNPREGSARMTKQADLLTYLMEGLPPQHPAVEPLAGALTAWMAESPRFTAFVETYRDKIRKKMRVVPDTPGALDLRSELAVAHALLTDRRLAVAYEPYASAKRRGPDFSVTYRANLVFNVEVARIREDLAREEDAGREQTAALARKEERVVRILLDKLGQMQPGMANLLVIQAAPRWVQAIDLPRLMQAVKLRVERRDPAFFGAGPAGAANSFGAASSSGASSSGAVAASRYRDPAGFYKDFLRLSAILLWPEGGDAASAKQLWVHKSARPALPEAVLRLVERI
jgi:hypothetical protein